VRDKEKTWQKKTRNGKDLSHFREAAQEREGLYGRKKQTWSPYDERRIKPTKTGSNIETFAAGS